MFTISTNDNVSPNMTVDMTFTTFYYEMIKHIWLVIPTKSGKSDKALLFYKYSRHDSILLPIKNTSVQVSSNYLQKWFWNFHLMILKTYYVRSDRSKSPLGQWNLTPFLLSSFFQSFDVTLSLISKSLTARAGSRAKGAGRTREQSLSIYFPVIPSISSATAQ